MPALNAIAAAMALVFVAIVVSGCANSSKPIVSAPISAPTETLPDSPPGSLIQLTPINHEQMQNPAVQVTPIITPIPTITPTPDPISAIPQTMEQEATRNLLNDEGGVYGFVVLDDAGRLVASYNSFTPFVTASTYKLILMADIYRRIENGEYGQWEQIYLDPEKFDPGGGDNYYNWESAGTYTTLQDLLYAVGAWSSNVAAHHLLTLTTPEDLNATAKSIGMLRTCILCDPYSLPFWPPAPGIDSSWEDMNLALDYIAVEAELGPVNLTTPYDMAVYQLGVLHDTVISPWVSQQIFEVLSQQAIRDRLNVYNQGITVMSKPGNLAGVVNDTALLFLPGGARAVAALSINVPDDERATKIIQLLGLIASGTSP
ncbi:MAG: serine hydrolase [Thermomicrobiales bacterium]|nr:serine hydrolase [Thermomicrobiales bacterium]